MSDARYETVQERAYHLWMAEGCPEGKSDEHWLLAEKQVSAVCAPIQIPTAAKAPPKRKAAAAAKAGTTAAKARAARPAATSRAAAH